MSAVPRSAASLLGLVIVLSALAADGPSKKPPTSPFDEPAAPAPPFQLATDAKLGQKLEAARDYDAAEDWAKACEVLRGFLNSPEDRFVEAERKGPDGKAVKVTVGSRREADRIIGQMPAAGLEVYRKAFGDEAKELLASGRDKKDSRLLAQVATRYSHTDAGAEAMRALALEEAERKQFVAAGLWFERLFDRRPADKESAEVLYHAARAFRLGHSAAAFEKTWKLLEEKVGDKELRVGERSQTLTQWREQLDKEAADRHDLGTFDALRSRGGAAPAAGESPLLVPEWRLTTIRADTTEKIVTQSVKAVEARNGVALGGAVPLFGDSKLVYRCTDGIWAVSLKDGSLVWNTNTVPWNLDNMAAEGHRAGPLLQWVQAFSAAGKSNVVFENSTIGVLSADNTYVYAVEDLPVPPYIPPFNGVQVFPAGMQERVNGNRLQAYSRQAGKLWWELGYKPAKKDDEATDLSESYFLGAPLPLDGVLYVLNERKQELRLLALDPAKGKLLWQAVLGNDGESLLQRPLMRISAASPAFAEGVLVCPTNSGAVVGFDLSSRSIAWVNVYAPSVPRAKEQPPVPFPPAVNTKVPRGWKAPRVMIADGKVLVAAPDSDDLLCLGLRDGALQWKMASKDDDLYVGGVFGERVLIVGKKECRAVSLLNGTLAWAVETGTPSGLGAGDGDVYFLPLKVAAADKGPEVWTIDLSKGQVKAKTHSRQAEPIGNLIFAGDRLVSQSLTSVVAYPLSERPLKDIDERLKKDPKDPQALVERAQIKLARGDSLGAAEDLKTALAGEPAERVRLRGRELFREALVDLLQRDFDKGEKYLDDLAALGRLERKKDAGRAELKEVETQERLLRAEYLLLLARGREKQGKRVEALRAYLDFGLLGDDDGLVPALDSSGRLVARTALAVGAVAGLLRDAGDDDRKPLEEELERRWKELQDANNPELLKRFTRIVAP